MTEGQNKVLHDVYRILNYNIQPLLIKISEIFKIDFCQLDWANTPLCVGSSLYDMFPLAVVLTVSYYIKLLFCMKGMASETYLLYLCLSTALFVLI